VSSRELWDEIMLFLKSGLMAWIVAIIIFNLLWLPLFGLGLYHYSILLSKSLIHYLLSYFFWPIIIINLITLEEFIFGELTMDNRFYFICSAIVFAMFVWHIVFIQGAY
jgi:hypothetical protein